MNKERRRTLAGYRNELEAMLNKTERLKLTELSVDGLATEDLQSSLEEVKDEEQEYYDNMPEALQGGEKGANAQEAIGNLDTAISCLQDAQSIVEEFNDRMVELIDNLEQAIDAIASAEGA